MRARNKFARNRAGDVSATDLSRAVSGIFTFSGALVLLSADHIQTDCGDQNRAFNQFLDEIPDV